MLNSTPKACLSFVACEQAEGKERGKREPVEMAKDFDFQMPVIYAMFK